MKIMLLALTLLISSTVIAATQPAAQRPHVLFIAVDDLRPELGCYGATHIHSPNIDRLASEGLLFENAYTQMAVCMPARASLMSGLRPTTGKMYGRAAMVDHVPDALSLNQHFMNASYDTVTIGKIYHHTKDNNAGWTRNFRDIEGPWGVRGYIQPASLELEAKNKPRGKRGPAFESTDVADDGYQTAAFADKAIEQLRNIGDKPLFLALGFRKPHLPFNAPKQYWDLYDPDTIARTAFPEPPKNAPQEGFTNWGELRHYAGMPDSGPMPEEHVVDLIRGYYACISYVDAQLGRVLDELDRLGLRDDTVVILWSDHGFKLGDYDMWCKHTNYEIDTRVPLIVRAPGMKETDTRTSAIVELLDIYPTLCDLAGLPKPTHLHGTSFAPLLSDADHPWDEAAFSIFAGSNAINGRGNIGYSVRHGEYRYTEWRRAGDNAYVARELYDHTESVLVPENLAERPEHAERIAELSTILRDGHHQAWDLE